MRSAIPSILRLPLTANATTRSSAPIRRNLGPSPRFSVRLSTPRHSSRRTFGTTPHRPKSQNENKNENTDLPPGEFFSVVDEPGIIVRAGHRRSMPGLIFLAIIPVTAFILGTWQVQRLGWKTDLIARLEDRLTRDPLPLPPRIDPSAVPEFDYRRVFATGRFRHDREMLIGPRMRDGDQGYLVVTPLERPDGASTILVNRGWISKSMRDQRARSPDALPQGMVTVEGLLREPWKKNMFTPDNKPEKGEFYFPDVQEMAAWSGSDPVWIEVTMQPEYLRFLDLQTQGVPIGRPAEVSLRNNHAQYIFTWYGLAAATSVMLWMVARKPASASEAAKRVRMNNQW